MRLRHAYHEIALHAGEQDSSLNVECSFLDIIHIIYEIYPPEDVVWYTHPCTCACTLALLRTSPMLYMGVDTADRAEQRMYDAHTYVSKCYHA